MNTEKLRNLSLGCVIAATIIDGLLAGGNVDRSLIAMPAWRETGYVAWANFSRYADLGNGIFLYPFMAISGTLLCVISAYIFLWIRHRPIGTTLSFLFGSFFMLASIPLSLMAAPFMLSLRHIDPQNGIAFEKAFSGFEYWGRWQGFLHVAAFCANIGSIVALGRNESKQIIP